MKFRSMKFKISILYTLILGTILLVYSAILYLNLSYVVYREIDNNLRRKALEIGKIIDAYSDVFEAKEDGIAVSLKRAIHLEEVVGEEFFQWPSITRMDEAWQYKIKALGIKQDFIVVYYPAGDMVEKSDNVDGDIFKILEKSFKGTATDKIVVKNVTVKDFHARVIAVPFYRWNKVRYIIQLATPLEWHLFILKSKLRLILLTIPVFMLFSSLIGRFLVVKMFKPIVEITRTARALSHKDMSQRVVLKHPDDELGPLVEGFNDMIARLEKNFRYIEEFSSNVAHELKTPLAIIRGELELALRKSRGTEEYRKAIVIALDESQRMLKTISDLLLLAKLDYQAEVFRFEPVDLGEFLSEIGTQGKAIAGEKEILVRLIPLLESIIVQADKFHLRRLFFNIIDNAIKFTPKGGTIDIAAVRDGAHVCVAVADSGAGIAPADLPKIFDRFFRVTRTEEAPPANGLGLSIVESIAKIHQGRVEVASEPGKGATFTLILPICA